MLIPCIFLFKVYAKQSSSKNFTFRFLIYHSLENFTASKNMCSLNVFGVFLPSKNRKNSKGVENPIFRLFFFIKLSFPSFLPTWIIQTAILLFSFEDWIRKWPESSFRPKCLSAKAVERAQSQKRYNFFSKCCDD